MKPTMNPPTLRNAVVLGAVAWGAIAAAFYLGVGHAHAAAVPTYCGPQTEGGSCEPGNQQKVYLNTARDALSTTGNVAVNNTGIPTVSITSDTSTTLNMFFDSANGFATITPGGRNTTFAGITFTIEPGYAYTELNFDVQLTPHGAETTQLPFTIQDLLNGQLIAPIGNMSDVKDTDKEFSVTLAGGVANATNIFAGPSGFGFDEIKHIEVGGVCQLNADSTSCTPVVFNTPEPASLAVLGVGLLGLGFASRRRRA